MSEAAASDPLSLARELILRPGGLDDRRLDQVFGQVLAHSVDFADLYFQLAHQESWSLEDGIVKDGSASIEQGVGVRALSGEKTGFAYSDEIVLPALLEAAGSARAIAQASANGVGTPLAIATGRGLYPAIDPIETLSSEDKIGVLRELDALCRSLDPRVKQVIVSIAASLETVLLASSDGTLAADVRPLVRVNVQVIAEQNGRRESGNSGGGGRYGFKELLENGRAHGFAREAV